MDIKIGDLKHFLDKKIRIVTKIGYTFVGYILSYGNDYLRIKDKYDQERLILFENIIQLEEARI